MLLKILGLNLERTIRTTSNLLQKITQSLKYGERIHHITWATNRPVMIIPHASDGYKVVQEISFCYKISGVIFERPPMYLS
jgi:hypothetical protein